MIAYTIDPARELVRVLVTGSLAVDDALLHQSRLKADPAFDPTFSQIRALALNEPPAAGLLAAAPDGPAILKQFGAGQAEAREAFRARDLVRAVPLFVDAVGGAGAFERRSPADRTMAMDNGLAHVADTISTRPRAPFDCDTAKRITAPTLLTNGERSPQFFHRVTDELERCLPRSERVMVPAASHTVPRENAQGYADAVLAFLRRN
jgi:non-heme chloroperoxidase